MIPKKYDWEEGQLLGNYLYYEVDTGRIVGEVSRIGMTGSRSTASTYIDVNNTVPLGNYIDYKWAKKAVEKHIDWYDRVIEGNLLNE